LVDDVFELLSPESLLPTVRSVVVCGYSIWDPVYNLVVTGPDPSSSPAFHQLYAEVASNKAWEVAHFLESRGYEAISTRGICLKKAAVLAGMGAQGKHTVVVSPRHGADLRFSAVLTSAELEEDQMFSDDLCGDCTRCLNACPTGALKPYSIYIKRCMGYAAENPDSEEVQNHVRVSEKRFIRRSSRHSFVECTICLDACPVKGKNEFSSSAN
jgi:epoxyqueuosine reductase